MWVISSFLPVIYGKVRAISCVWAKCNNFTSQLQCFLLRLRLKTYMTKKCWWNWDQSKMLCLQSWWYALDTWLTGENLVGCSLHKNLRSVVDPLQCQSNGVFQWKKVVLSQTDPMFPLASDKAEGDHSFSMYIYGMALRFRQMPNSVASNIWDFLNSIQSKYATVLQWIQTTVSSDSWGMCGPTFLQSSTQNLKS